MSIAAACLASLWQHPLRRALHPLSLTPLRQNNNRASFASKMPSSKGKPTDPKLREEVKEEVDTTPANAPDLADVKNETNKDGSGKGQMTAWKAALRVASLIPSFHLQGAKIAKEYEKKGGDYENEAGSKNEPSKGAPEPKSAEEKKDEAKTDAAEKKDDKKDDKEKPKANSAKKATGKKAETKAKAPKKEKKAPTEGTRKSTRISGKRSAPEDEKKTEEKAPAKKAKTAKK
ncbi:MAG: hypothetical protein Q9203_001597 [Teloschistes exilis]